MSDNETTRPGRFRPVASIATALSLLAGGLLFAEHDAGARTLPRAARAQAPQTVTAPDLPTAPAATPTATAAVDSLPADASLAQVQAFAAQEIVNPNVTAAQAAVANQTFSPSIASLVCPILLFFRSQIVIQFGLLIARFPAFTTPLLIQRNAALAIIDQLLRFFGCPVPSGTALA